MAIVALVDIATADNYNVTRSDWLALTDPVKTQHIWNASLYIQSGWTCTDIDWDDDTTWTDDLKRACSYYAYADSLGVLFKGAYSDDTPRGKLIEETKRVEGAVLKSVKWAETGANVIGDPLGMIDSIMLTMCTRTGAGGGVPLVRV